MRDIVLHHLANSSGQGYGGGRHGGVHLRVRPQMVREGRPQTQIALVEVSVFNHDYQLGGGVYAGRQDHILREGKIEKHFLRATTAGLCPNTRPVVRGGRGIVDDGGVVGLLTGRDPDGICLGRRDKHRLCRQDQSQRGHRANQEGIGNRALRGGPF